ncbi:NAD-dependent epimerase/dehydratase family protein [Desulfosporosinus fructosivorans]|uniref:NAD-dependent epimerase/dehydratase family protein n=1 Tax=Desulfosporosinus fructosivorans TaxID=2018669 RepID=A0A4Z0R115_9FIRM|nr:NAD-dependent epimerase/dehydratase family protein [Desulfosporosinus fructosivorans]TGE36440.1 NAD-dependent epimerase/dehydratase family protein [Desulfosporosinus fructosivorans]
MSKVMITGATGFIGSHIARAFCESLVSVGCLVREGSSLANLEGLPVEIKTGDIKNIGDLTKAFAGYDWVIHNAAKVSDWGNYDEFYQTNVTGTINVLTACVQAGIKNVLITGSNSVYGEENTLLVKDETSPYNSHYQYFGDRFFPCKLNFYRDTKALAKKEALEFAGAFDLNLTILEPVWVYGEMELNGGFYEYLKTAKARIPLVPGAKQNKFHVIYAGDLARAYVLAYTKHLTGVNCILVGNEQAESMDRIYRLFCSEAGLKKPGNLPKPLSYPIALLMELLYTVVKAQSPPLLTRGRVNMFYDNLEVSVAKAEQLLGFRNAYSLEEGIKKTVLWYKEQGLI